MPTHEGLLGGVELAFRGLGGVFLAVVIDVDEPHTRRREFREWARSRLASPEWAPGQGCRTY